MSNVPKTSKKMAEENETIEAATRRRHTNPPHKTELKNTEDVEEEGRRAGCWYESVSFGTNAFTGHASADLRLSGVNACREKFRGTSLTLRGGSSFPSLVWPPSCSLSHRSLTKSWRKVGEKGLDGGVRLLHSVPR